MVEKAGGIDFSMPFGTIYSGVSSAILQKYISDSEHLWRGKTENVPIHILGATIGTHVGPGAIGLAFFGQE